MPHGLPDYSMYLAKTIHRVVDVGELATRLGSIDTFDRRGDVVWFDDFESDIRKWEATSSGAGSEIASSAERARNGAFSAKLTTGDAVDDWAQLVHGNPYPVISKVGFEISFTLNEATGSLYIYQVLYDGSYLHNAGLSYTMAGDILQYLDEDGNWQNLATGIDLYPIFSLFHTIKLVIDLETAKYVRAILNEDEFDMSALAYQHTASGVTPMWTQVIVTTAVAATNVSTFVDDAIITQNEP